MAGEVRQHTAHSHCPAPTHPEPARPQHTPPHPYRGGGVDGITRPTPTVTTAPTSVTTPTLVPPPANVPLRTNSFCG
ncbi:hypothetical protein Pcinc_034515 [Petrolisthes cinctipes]|uniref:Uncharacterized protein n=1 Tax=Petrolisthes cinctipes TaxID=88211 RepID=A0AAE1JZ18_PETCI|nr:hypothetical protein Pcinc_039357 [Petrolisthes cinctipes]KAK3859373.1 hypothetical protein Pcinc_034515 [Petrolisthes cinctipes]